MSIFNNNIDNYKNKVFVEIDIDTIKMLPKYSYILRMSENQIKSSNLFISTLIQFSDKNIDTIVHSANLKGINI